jgi:hypothetical protein
VTNKLINTEQVTILEKNNLFVLTIPDEQDGPIMLVLKKIAAEIFILY